MRKSSNKQWKRKKSTTSTQSHSIRLRKSENKEDHTAYQRKVKKATENFTFTRNTATRVAPTTTKYYLEKKSKYTRIDLRFNLKKMTNSNMLMVIASNKHKYQVLNFFLTLWTICIFFMVFGFRFTNWEFS